MNLDLREYTEFPASVDREVEAVNEDYEINGIEFVDLMHLVLTIQKVGDEYLCQGEVVVKTEQECSRCLNPFETDLSGELNFVLITEKGKSVMARDKGADVILFNPAKPVVELNEVIRQALMLSIPMKPLCSDDCLGICPNCGVNLNEQTCNCVTEDIDDRWEGLKDLYD
jgi:uncharacterized protein